MRKKQYQRIFFISILFFVSMVVLLGDSVYAAKKEVIIISGGKSTIKNRYVQVGISPPEGMTQMRIHTHENLRNIPWQPIRRQFHQYLEFGSGVKSLYVQFRNKENQVSDVYFDRIRLIVPKTMAVNMHINKAAKETDTRKVELSLTFSSGVEAVAFSNTSNFDNALYKPVKSRVPWVLAPGVGEKTVYALFRDGNGKTQKIQRKITFSPKPDYIPEGTVVKGPNNRVYYLGFDEALHPFLDSSAFLSHNRPLSKVVFVSQNRLDRYNIGKSLCVRPGTWLVKFAHMAQVYAVEHGCYLRPLRSEAEAYVIYGDRWQRRVVELHPSYRAFYSIEPVSKERVEDDADRDGVIKSVELEYGTSDSLVDTDNDRVSDYEEIFIWFSDPTVSDTDQDGMADGTEIILGRSPVGAGPITQIRGNGYTYPKGSVVSRNNRLYYFHQNNKAYYLAKNTSSRVFTSNFFNKTFIIEPPFTLDLPVVEGWITLSDNEYIRGPLQKIHTRYYPL